MLPLTRSDLLPPTKVATYELTALQSFEVIQVPRGHSLGLDSFHRNSPEYLSSDINPSISIIPSFLSPEIPLDPRIPLLFLGEERLQISDADMTDIDMRSCVFGPTYTRVTGSLIDASRLWMLLRLPKFGIYLKRERLDALVSGDLSGTVLDRFWVLASHALGMPYCFRVDTTPGMVQLQARRTQIAWESLAELVKRNDHKLKVQTILMVASGYVYRHMIQSAFLYIQKSCDYIEAGNLQLIPTYGHPPEFSEELHETLAILSQTIYLANYLFLMCGGPEPRATAKLEREFRSELPVGDRHTCQVVHRVDHLPQRTYPLLIEICPLTMRTQGILFVRDVILLLNATPADGEHPAPASTIGIQ